MEHKYTVETPYPPKQKYKSNYVSTTKYNAITFLPYSLILQFRRYANFYFLACAILQSIPIISPLSPLSAILPLAFVLSLSMAREGFEDYKRWKSDKESNSNITHLYNNNNLNKVSWKVIKPGDLVKIYAEELFPVDMIPLYCSQQSGISYVQTSSLDGQKNLKPKISLPYTQLSYNKNPKQFPPHFHKIRVQCQEPNADINKFLGRITFESKKNQNENIHVQQVQVNHKNLMLRGTKLKNTQWIVGYTVYTGVNTKIMQNGCGAHSKVSNIQRKANNIILLVLLFQLVCCGVSATFCYFSCIITYQFEALVFNSQIVDCSSVSGITFASYFILYSTFIPISLIVSLQFVKVFQGYAMQHDKQMFCAINDHNMQCHSVSINQQLGQIQYILTDKTGTLTCNKMQFKNVVVGHNVYGQDIKIKEIDKQFDFSKLTKRFAKAGNKHKQQFDSRSISYSLSANQMQQSMSVSGSLAQNGASNHKQQIQLVFFMIATCHECLRDSSGSYHGPSPDQVALVTAAKKIGFQFINTENKVTTVDYQQKQHKFQILKLIQFDSDRKRMTVVVRWNNNLYVFVKGADTSITKLLGKNQKYLKYITDKTKQMAKTGLRSLWFAYKTLPTNFDIQSAQLDKIQSNLTLIAATAIEDRLQDYVPETIYSLKQGGIKFIMLTGDKLETADNIARSCKMIEEGFLIDNKGKLQEGIEYIGQIKETQGQDVCPVIDGSTISFQENLDSLHKLIEMSTSAVFCRVTPSQKAEIVKLVKEMGKRTLAIGDGANDVNMILEAHVGVGIFGEEGTRAAQVSNYAIGQFCLIWKLLLYYGRLNYMRISQMILYFFYKNMVFTIVQFGFCFYNLGSGQSFWLSWSITLYNMVFTLVPVIVRAVFEVDVQIQSNKKTLKSLAQGNIQDTTMYSYYPKMYIISQKNQLFTNLAFFSWYTLGILQGLICLFIMLYSMSDPTDTSGSNSYQTGLYFTQLSAYTSVIIVVTVKLAINVKNWNCLLVLGFLIPSFGAYICFCVLQNQLYLSIVYGQFNQLLVTPSFYLSNVLAVLGMFTMDLMLYSVESTKNNFQNYFKKRALTGRRMTESNLEVLMSKL